MNKLSKLLGAFAPTTKATIDDWIIHNMAKPGGDDTSVMEDPYSNVHLVYTCISTTARAIAQVPLMAIKYDNWGNPIPLEATAPWQRLLNRPNPQMNRTMFIEAIIGHWLNDGNVCIIIYPNNRKQSKLTPEQMWVVPWKYMEPITDKKTGRLEAWLYKPGNTKPILLGMDDVIHLKFWNPEDPIMGMAPSKAGKIPILSLYKAQSYNHSFFANGAMPGAVFETEKQLGDKTFNRLKSQLEGEHRIATGKAHKWMILEQGLKMVQRGVTQKDMDFLGLQRLSGEEIMQIFGMKKSIISVTEDLNFATAKEERKSWWQDTCRPLMRIIEDMLQFGLGIEVLFDVSSIEALHESFADKAKTCESLMRLGFTRNEVNKRLEMGFAEVEWGDIAYMPVNMMAVNVEGAALPDPDDTENPNNPGEDDPETPSDDEDDDLENHPPDDTDDAPTPDEGGNTRSLPAENIKALEKRWQFTIAALQPKENLAHSKVRRVLHSMRKKTLDALTKNGVDGVLNLRFEKETNNLLKSLNPILVDVMRLGISMILEEEKAITGTQKDFAMDDEMVIRNYLESKEMLIRGIPDRVRLQVLSSVQRVLSENAERTYEEVADMIQHSVREVFNITQKRSRTIARTEIMGAFNHARSERMIRMAGEALQKAWVTIRDGHDRPNHTRMMGRVTGVTESWILPDGAIMRYPGDPAGGAKNCCNCRCMEILIGG